MRIRKWQRRPRCARTATVSTPVSSADIPFQGNADHSLCSGRVPSLLRCSHEHLADASGTALMRLGTASVLISSTSYTFTRKPSEVQCFSRVSPTLLLGNCRRSCGYKNQEEVLAGILFLGLLWQDPMNGCNYLPASCLTFKGFVHISQTVSQMLNLMRLAMIQYVEQQYLRFRSEEQNILYANASYFH